MKTFIIVGLSTFGHYMAEFLSERDFEVVAVDADEARVDRVKPYVVKGVIGNAADKSLLESLGVKSADAVIVSLGDSIDASLLAVMYLKEIGVERIYVKVLNEEHAKIVRILEVTEIIFPEKDSAFTIAQRIDSENVLDYVPLMQEYSIIEWTPSEKFVGKSLKELDLRNRYKAHVIVIHRGKPTSTTIVPYGDYQVQEDDHLIILGHEEDIEELRKSE